ncbi:alcohol dehydrogenase [Brevibacterium spongiae]|uniref:alcohol dehydrogenase n=1 Tax=Brevibacterium spongiae TaxID=2909672 RepID=A0ABY5STN5_9MICO|nr:alcohol dehydrogenase [Brevibacterium spongiae]PZO61924.1 MAG: alcohol dehydrogenase [Pseudoxanthomonas suwonensis]UVI36396.1 alcohol dehydrogenase [Brevibacterium spongiae]
MKAFAIEKISSPVSEIELSTPTPVDHQVLLKVTHSGICHTDTHVQAGGYDLGSRGFMSMTDRGLTLPAVMGHETVGEVIAVGDSADESLIGEKRLVFPWIGCGECGRCLAHQENYCDSSQALGIFRPGGFAEEILVPHEKYLVDITGLDAAWAATLGCSGVTSYSAVRKAREFAAPDETIAVIGAGGVGLMAIAMLSAVGHRNIAAVDVNDENLRAAQKLGATTIVNSSDGEGSAKLKSRAGGPVSAVIDFVNTGETVTLGFDALTKGGICVLVGLFGGEFVMPTAVTALKALTVRGNYVGSLDELKDVVQLAKRSDLPKIPISPRPLNAESINSGLDDLRAGKVRGRIVLHSN